MELKTLAAMLPKGTRFERYLKETDRWEVWEVVEGKYQPWINEQYFTIYRPFGSPFTVSRYPSLCGAGIFNGFGSDCDDEGIALGEQIIKKLGYTVAMASVNNERAKDHFVEQGWKVTSEFVNRNTNSTIYMMEKHVR